MMLVYGRIVANLKNNFTDRFVVLERKKVDRNLCSLSVLDKKTGKELALVYKKKLYLYYNIDGYETDLINILKYFNSINDFIYNAKIASIIVFIAVPETIPEQKVREVYNKFMAKTEYGSKLFNKYKKIFIEFAKKTDNYGISVRIENIDFTTLKELIKDLLVIEKDFYEYVGGEVI